MTENPDRNGVLIYLNRATRKYSIVSDSGLHRMVGQNYWDRLGEHFSEDLRSTHFENAITLLIYAIGATLEKKFRRNPAKA